LLSHLHLLTIFSQFFIKFNLNKIKKELLFVRYINEVQSNVH